MEEPLRFASFEDARLPDSFWEKIAISPSGCWEWTANKRPNGYARIRLAGREWHAHRLVYQTLVAPILPGLEIDHLCRVRHCVNPAHLEPVTKLENVRRGNSGINHSSKTHCKHGHEFTPENTKIERGARQCQICRRARNAARYQK